LGCDGTGVGISEIVPRDTSPISISASMSRLSSLSWMTRLWRGLECDAPQNSSSWESGAVDGLFFGRSRF
jgi:hypothetical protein